MKAVETKLVSWSVNKDGEVRIGFVAQRDDFDKVDEMRKMVGHAFELDITKIDYDNPQPAQEGQQRHDPARAKLHARVGILSKDPAFFLWAQKYYPQHATADLGPGAIRGFCQVKSRRDIVPGTQAELRFNLLESAYRASTLREA